MLFIEIFYLCMYIYLYSYMFRKLLYYLLYLFIIFFNYIVFFWGKKYKNFKFSILFSFYIIVLFLKCYDYECFLRFEFNFKNSRWWRVMICYMEEFFFFFNKNNGFMMISFVRLGNMFIVFIIIFLVGNIFFGME